jgi:hypothetical protein
MNFYNHQALKELTTIFFKFKIVLLFQILAAMQRELAASGLSPEEILAKTLLLQKVPKPNLTKPKPNQT